MPKLASSLAREKFEITNQLEETISKAKGQTLMRQPLLFIVVTSTKIAFCMVN
jgi:hypothetical protein